MLTSIVHRITGVGMGIGFLFLACWLLALSLGEGPYEAVAAFHRSYLGRLFLLGFSWAVIFHLFSGTRHLFWDRDLGFEKSTYNFWSIVMVVMSFVVTLILWWLAYSMRGY